MKQWMKQYGGPLSVSGLLLCALLYRSAPAWQEIGTVQGIGAGLAGTFIISQRWRVLWTCDHPGPLSLQIDSETVGHLTETTDCDGKQRMLVNWVKSLRKFG
ncbi:MAG TPA: hypothetical protein VKR06_21180 [Ktedonosporobacter sp.]|nr:hypothetical protein [Ktedonosporobacter sp.]